MCTVSRSTYRSGPSLIAVVSLFMLLLAACDSGGSNGEGDGGDSDGFPEPPGRPGFTSTVTGAWAASLTGTATHELSPSSTGPAPRVIRLRTNGAAPHTIVLRSAAPLQAGLHRIQAAPEKPEGVKGQVRTAGGRVWTATAGRLRIEAQAGPAVAGTFRFAAAGDGGQLITVEGSFRTALAPQS